MEADKREKLFRLAADGDVEALKEVLLEASRQGIYAEGLVVACHCGALVKIAPKEVCVCRCGKRWRYSTTIYSKAPRPNPQDFGGLQWRNEVHSKQCHECSWWFQPKDVESTLVCHHKGDYEDFCRACLKEAKIKEYVEHPY